MSQPKNNPKNDPLDYEVGYGKPPVATRFKPGQSGNPAGRKRGSLNINSILKKAMSEVVVVNERGRSKRLTKMEVAVRQIINKAAAGDINAFKLTYAMASQIDPTVESVSPDLLADQEQSRQLLARLLGRKDADSEGGDQ
jgi:Family of unknown function (DUF5681)